MGQRWIRWAMYQKLRPIVSNFETPSKCLLLGGGSKLTHVMPKGIETLVTCLHPGRSQAMKVDAEDTPFDDNQWDYVISDQMLEHVRKPWKAVGEMHRIVKPGGVVICTTCSYNPVHRCPIDCYRFMPDGMRALFEDFSSVQVGTWGDRDAIMYDVETGGNARGNYPKERMEKAIRANARRFPWSIWAVATK